MKKVKSEKFGIVHYFAQCKDCNWDCGIRTEEAHLPQDVRNRIYSHIKKTGHRVQAEAGTSTDYFLTK